MLDKRINNLLFEEKDPLSYKRIQTINKLSLETDGQIGKKIHNNIFDQLTK